LFDNESLPLLSCFSPPSASSDAFCIVPFTPRIDLSKAPLEHPQNGSAAWRPAAAMSQSYVADVNNQADDKTVAQAGKEGVPEPKRVRNPD
jgi:hypothetical protein